ncbi:MAG: DUF4157 domain-containing protein, partial [Cytophagales bacterium]|nr:DUF4157 domain-containing protein [Cytophagales bacterium]
MNYPVLPPSVIPALSKTKAKLAVQPTLQINQPGDQYEQEADAMAERVMHRANTPPGPVTGLIGASVQRKCAACEEEEKKSVMRKESRGSSSIPTSIPAASTPSFSQSTGTALPKETRHFMENAFSADFSKVRVHTDGKASEMSKGINANAFTYGNNIYFNSGQYAPEHTEGKKLLAHELTHTLQQSSVTGGLIQRRRVPGTSELGAALPPTASSDTSIAAEIGMARILSRAWGELTAVQQAAVRTGTTALGLSWTDQESLRLALLAADRAMLISFATAMRTAAPALTLGDPLLINTGPRAGTADAANIATLVTNANAIFTAIAGTARNTDIGQVFGTGNIGNAKARYNNARVR